MGNAYRNYKDNVFCLLHREKANLLELYNALNGTFYGDPRDLTVVTLPNAICIQYRNDAAYTFNSDLSLYGQQSTDNPNIPLWMLHYISEEYKKIIPNKLLYRGKAIRIPTPHFIVFFNGTEPMPEKKIYRLSELFEKPAGRPELDLTVTVLNINNGNNQELLAKCKTLRDYMSFVNKVRAKKRQAGGHADWYRTRKTGWAVEVLKKLGKSDEQVKKFLMEEYHLDEGEALKIL